ncbi:DUF4407 domain-containing protein [Streptomyces sp. NPDC046985]|uniref:DUF4407 domain-containing protein n=1 Tax=Streptomyces sp. NPDC046985 TaxID=3155377 RepID=UPI00340FA963
MRHADLAGRYWRSLTGRGVRDAASPRDWQGHPLWRRYLASLVDLPLASFEEEPGRSAVAVSPLAEGDTAGGSQAYGDTAGGSRAYGRGSRAARWLRKSVGVDEDLLKWVPAERPMFTRLGAGVLATAALGGCAIWAGLGVTSGVNGWLRALLSVAWAVVAFSLDCWLMARIASGGVRRNLGRIALTLSFASVQAFFLSGMLLLRVFDTNISVQAADFRMTRRHPLGFIESMEALRALYSGDPSVHAAAWAVQLLFVVASFLPVLIRLIGGESPYDRLARLRGERAEKLLHQSTHMVDAAGELNRLAVQLLEAQEELEATKARLRETERRLATATTETGRRTS